ncbi:hypothetical protein AB5I41_22865 [Sphingomonas sp. MMS24-JH45]
MAAAATRAASGEVRGNGVAHHADFVDRPHRRAGAPRRPGGGIELRRQHRLGPAPDQRSPTRSAT